MNLTRPFLSALAICLPLAMTAPSAWAGFNLPRSAASVPQANNAMDHAALEQGGAQLLGAIHLQGVVNTLSDTAVNVTHDANPRIGWPAMTMDLPLAPYVQIAPGIGPGTAVTLMLTLGDRGSYRIAAIVPAF